MWLWSRIKLARRVRTLEAECDALRRSLEAEKDRSRLREDALVDRILTMAGQYAISNQVRKEMTASRPPVAPARLTAYQEAVKTAYREAALREGRTVKEADALFDAWLTSSTPDGERPYLEVES